MVIIAVDDEKIAIEGIVDILRKAEPEAEVYGFGSGEEALAFARQKDCDVAFLDIKMRGMDGIELAKRMKMQNPHMNIIFSTGYSDYMGEAFALHASGYIMKPITMEKVKKELEDLRHPVKRDTGCRIRIQTFGNFEVFLDDKPMKFKYSKTKELLAYLVDRNGALCTNGELIGILWENEEKTSHISYLKNLYVDLLKAFEDAGMEDAIMKRRGQIGIVPERLCCDYFDWLKGKADAINSYRGEYMIQYSWSEFTNGGISQKR